jgi:mono/diheme cytochrome c family protein
MTKSILLVLSGIVLGLFATATCSYFWVRHHNFTARGKPSPLETRIAELTFSGSVPSDVAAQKNPLAADAAAAATGQRIFAQICSNCHGFSGDGKTLIGSGENPQPTDLRSRSVQRLSDGELFYVIHNGVRYTGMPYWTLGDNDIWCLVAYIRELGASTK